MPQTYQDKEDYDDVGPQEEVHRPIDGRMRQLDSKNTHVNTEMHREMIGRMGQLHVPRIGQRHACKVIIYM